MVVVAAINYRGIGESVRINIGLTFIEVGGLLLIIVIALGAVFAGDAEPSRAVRVHRATSRCRSRSSAAPGSRSTRSSASRTP